MSLSIAIVGLPNVGKSSLFNILTKKRVEVANYPFCTINPNIGVVKVPDDRLNSLAEVSKPLKIIPTTIEFVDIAGLVAGASKGEGLGNQFLAQIRECNAICEVIRNFKDENIVHVNGRIDPLEDKETINIELILADLASVNKRLEKTKKESRSGDRELILQTKILEKISQHLESGLALRSLSFDEEELIFINSLNLLSLKPIIYLINSDNLEDLPDFNSLDGEVIGVNIKMEEEISYLPENEQAEYIKELGLEQSGLDKLITTSYKLLGLVTFFTTGSDETKAWTVRTGTKAPEAAGVIHTDFIKGFIRAEIINWKELVEAHNEIRARELGLIRTEGRDYTIKDGDVCHFLVNQ
ncbi:MAG: redox-regulated ATPase YchF [Clostridia bacterium]|jgi:GTP-binding protein YchF|nr:redox-regulated ATPase YchF [Clostridia bacterium]